MRESSMVVKAFWLSPEDCPSGWQAPPVMTLLNAISSLCVTIYINAWLVINQNKYFIGV